MRQEPILEDYITPGDEEQPIIKEKKMGDKFGSEYGGTDDAREEELLKEAENRMRKNKEKMMNEIKELEKKVYNKAKETKRLLDELRDQSDRPEDWDLVSQQCEDVLAEISYLIDNN